MLLRSLTSYDTLLTYADVCCYTAYVSIRQLSQHTSAYVSIRQHTSAYVSIRQHPSAYVSIRQRVRLESPRVLPAAVAPPPNLEDLWRIYQ